MSVETNKKTATFDFATEPTGYSRKNAVSIAKLTIRLALGRPLASGPASRFSSFNFFCCLTRNRNAEGLSYVRS